MAVDCLEPDGHPLYTPPKFNASNLNMMGTPKPGSPGFPGGHFQVNHVKGQGCIYVNGWRFQLDDFCPNLYHGKMVGSTSPFHPSILSWLALEFQVIH